MNSLLYLLYILPKWKNNLFVSVTSSGRPTAEMMMMMMIPLLPQPMYIKKNFVKMFLPISRVCLQNPSQF